MPFMTPRRAWIAIVSLAAVILLVVLALSTSLEGRPHRHAGYRGLDVWKIDAREHAGPGTLSLAMNLASTQGIRGIVNYAGGHVGDGLEDQVAESNRFPGRVAVLMELDLAECCGEAWSGREVVRMVQGRAIGARGLSVPKALGLEVRDAAGRRVPLDSPELEPIWDMAWRLEIPVAVHAGDARNAFDAADGGSAGSPGALPRYGDRQRFPERRKVLEEFVRVVERHPQLAIVGVHFGDDAEDPAEVGRLLDRLPNLYVDAGARLGELGANAAAMRAACAAHPDRVLFATDLQWIEGPKPDLKAVVLGTGRPARSVEEIRRFFESTWRFFETRDAAIPSPTPEGKATLEGLGLPREVLEEVYHRNAERLFGFEPLEAD